jgi:hypothetical protein
MAQTRASESIEPLPKCKACDLAIVGVEVPQINALDAQSDRSARAKRSKGNARMVSLSAKPIQTLQRSHTSVRLAI